MADSIYKRYRGRTVLSAATLRLHAGRLTALLGRNGAGKSTLLRIAVGVESCDGGSVYLRNEYIAHPSLSSFAKQGVMFIPAQGTLCPQMRLGEQLALFQATVGASSVRQAVASLKLTGFEDRRVASLSGGERKRAELAAAIVRNPSCLVFDEAFRDLSPRDCELMSTQLRHLSNKGCAVAISGHELPFVFKVADSITLCTSGTTYHLGPPASALTSDLLRKEYLGATTCDHLVGL